MSSYPPRIRIDQCDEDQLAMAVLLGCNPASAERSHVDLFVQDGGRTRIEERPILYVDWRGRRRQIGPGGSVEVAPAPRREKPTLRVVRD